MKSPLVVTGALISQGRILLQQRSRTRSYCWMWETPGGKVEPNETATDAVAREWLEEVKLRVIAVRTLGERPFNVPDVERDFYMVAFHLSCDIIAPHITSNDGEGLGWFTLTEAYALSGTPSLKWMLSLVAYNQLLEK